VASPPVDMNPWDTEEREDWIALLAHDQLGAKLG